MIYTKRTRRKILYNRRKKTKKKKGGSQVINGQTLSFVSYGTDNYRESKDRIKKQAEKTGWFNGKIKVYSPQDLPEEFTKAVGSILNDSRGGGYWIWKSCIIRDMLSQINDNDYVLYADSGCSIQPAGLKRLKEYIEMISPESGQSVLCMRLVALKEKNWTTTAIFDYFGIPVDGEIGKLDQVIGGFQMYRKCAESFAVVNKMYEIATTRPDLFTDKYNEESKKKNPSFKDNRHDQSIFTIVVQIEPYKKTCKIIEEEIESIHGTKGESFYSDKPVVATRIK